MTATRRLLAVALLAAAAAVPAAQAGEGDLAHAVHCSGCSASTAQRLLEAVATRAVLGLDYSEGGAAHLWKMHDLPSLQGVRTFVQEGPGGALRTLELSWSNHPTDGQELHLYGRTHGAGEAQPNPDLPGLAAALDALVAALPEEQLRPDLRDLSFEVVKLSYAQADRTLALLKALGYTTVEYAAGPAESEWERVFEPIGGGRWRLPVVAKLLDSSKTSLLEPYLKSKVDKTDMLIERTVEVPEIGGQFLHQTTTGEPLQRLLVVHDPADPDSVRTLRSLLRDEIDVPARQIVIEALVIEVRTDKLRDVGVTFDWFENDLGASFERDEFGRQQPFTFVFDQFANPDLLSLRAAIHALVEEGDAEILSSPSVLVLDGRQARIQVGQQIPVVTATATVNVVQQGVQYFPVGIVLNLRPRLNEDGSEVTMQVETIVSAVDADSVTVSTGDDALFAPTILNRQVQTLVRIADNTPFIVGGLISSEERERISRVPGLSRIPLLGSLFRRKQVDNVQSEVIVVITPHVVPLEDQNFSYVRPKESERFDSFDAELFRNSYRIRQKEVFDLSFVRQNPLLQSITEQVREAAAERPELREQEPFAGLLRGEVPGEDVLVRRMMWETVRSNDFARHVDLNRVIVFERGDQGTGGLQLRFLSELLRARSSEKNALVLGFGGSPDSDTGAPSLRPADIRYEAATQAQAVEALFEGNGLVGPAEPDRSAIVLADVPTGPVDSLEALKSALVLKRLLELNSSLPLRIDEWYAGRALVYPTESELQSSFHVVDGDTARLFFETQHYYPAFEHEFNAVVHRVLGELDPTAELPPAPRFDFDASHYEPAKRSAPKGKGKGRVSVARKKPPQRR